MTAAHPVFFTFAEYEQLEELSPIKHEYLGGRVYAMAGGTPEHAALSMALGVVLGSATLGSRCRAFSSDLMVRVSKTGLCTYPDVSIVCGPREIDPESKNAVNNPVLLVEVTSRSTEEYDRGEKFDHYRAIPTLREYVLVSHREPAIEVRRRGDDGRWTTEIARAGERIVLASVPCTLDVTAIYASASDPGA
ncbi:MAG: Uma2 family endonuclease [Myxococcales bacterium]|nr:Uma2 family endonuclease [Myxococcales bacterium]